MNEIFTALVEADPFGTWWPFILSFVVGIVMAIKTYMGGQMCPSNQQLNNKVIILTGSTGGIGIEIAKELCTRSVAHLILACRNLKKAAEIKNALIKINAKVIIDIRHLDLESIQSVRQFAQTVQNDFPKIDVLINCAGGKFKIKQTSNGFEQNVQVNYLSQFLLTYLLLPLLKKSIQGRVINFTAHAYTSVKFTANNTLNSFEDDDNTAFAISKLAIVSSSIYLAKRIKGSAVTVNVLNPGMVRSTGHYEGTNIMDVQLPKPLLFPWMWLLMKTPQQGAQTAIYLATDETLSKTSGQLFNDCEKVDIAKYAKDENEIDRLASDTIAALEIDEFDF